MVFAERRAESGPPRFNDIRLVEPALRRQRLDRLRPAQRHVRRPVHLPMVRGRLRRSNTTRRVPQGRHLISSDVWRTEPIRPSRRPPSGGIPPASRRSGGSTARAVRHGWSAPPPALPRSAQPPPGQGRRGCAASPRYVFSARPTPSSREANLRRSAWSSRPLCLPDKFSSSTFTVARSPSMSVPTRRGCRVEVLGRRAELQLLLERQRRDARPVAAVVARGNRRVVELDRAPPLEHGARGRVLWQGCQLLLRQGWSPSRAPSRVGP